MNRRLFLKRLGVLAGTAAVAYTVGPAVLLPEPERVTGLTVEALFKARKILSQNKISGPYKIYIHPSHVGSLERMGIFDKAMGAEVVAYG